jgi:hypothetical protein
MMRKKILFIALFVICIYSVLGIASYCGDGYCTSLGEYNESDPRSSFFCPLDCGDGIITSTWCEDTFDLRSGDCATCPACNCGDSTCTTSRLSSSELGNWCGTNGYSLSGGSSGSASEDNKYIYWIIFLVIGFLIGKYYKGKKRK